MRFAQCDVLLVGQRGFVIVFRDIVARTVAIRVAIESDSLSY